MSGPTQCYDDLNGAEEGFVPTQKISFSRYDKYWAASNDMLVIYTSRSGSLPQNQLALND